MHAPQVGAQSYAVTGVPRGFGWKPGDHLERRDLEEHERIGPQRLDHRCRHLQRSGIDVALGPGQVFRPEAEDHSSSDPIAIGRRILGRNDERRFAAQGDHGVQIDGAVLAPECFVLRYANAQSDDRLLVVNLGRDLHLVVSQAIPFYQRDRKAAAPGDRDRDNDGSEHEATAHERELT